MRLGFLSILCVVPPLLAGALRAAETGDFDGDGRLSIGDIHHVRDGLRPAANSYDAFESWCAWPHERMPQTAVYMESLRRGTQGSFPYWFALDSSWAEDRPQAALPPDGGVTLRFGRMVAPGGEDDRVRIEMELTSFVAIRAFSLVLETDGDILRVPFTIHDQCTHWLWDEDGWWDTYAMDQCHQHDGGDLAVSVMPPTFLVSGGKYVVSYNVYGGPDDLLVPGTYVIAAEARWPRGARRGSYELGLHPASEVLLEDGTLVAPTLEAPGVIDLNSVVTSGWNGAPPPLQLDAENRRVVGNVEFRIVDFEGRPGTLEEPIAEAWPGQELEFAVEVRTEVPLNDLFFEINWPPGALQCVNMRMELTNPDDGEPYLPYVGSLSSPLPHCWDLALGHYRARFRLAGAGSDPNSRFTRYGNNYVDRPFEYFKPLGEWTTISSVRLRVPVGAAGGQEIPLLFDPYHRRVTGELKKAFPVQFAPYLADWPCDSENKPEDLLWSYDLSYQSSFVRVLGSSEPPPPPDLGIRVTVGEAAGRPGELVEVPVFASTDTPLATLMLVLESNPAIAVVEAVEVPVRSEVTGETVRVIVSRGESFFFQESIDDDGDGIPDEPSTSGVPMLTQFRDLEERYCVIEWLIPSFNDLGEDYPGPSHREIARLLVRIRDDPPAGLALLLPTKVTVVEDGFEKELETGGYAWPLQDAIHGPASEVRGGRITITGVSGRSFVRGDANADGNGDLSDAVTILGFLFLGGEGPACSDAADVDDSGDIQITDAIFHLAALFLGGQRPPPPYPDCGGDESADPLDCRSSSCGEEVGP